MQAEISSTELSDGSDAYDVLLDAKDGSGKVGTVRMACESEEHAAELVKALRGLSWATFTVLPA